MRKPLEEYLALEYRFSVIADPDGGYVIDYPDLPGCTTQIDSLDELVPMAEDVRRGWLETAYEQEGYDIPLPTYLPEYSGKFNLRLPRSLHRTLAEAAERDGVSLNSYAAELLARGDAQAQLERRLGEIEVLLRRQLAAMERQPESPRQGAYPQPAVSPGQAR
jgi:predicted RNase H-like HicB family nuclease